MTTLPIECPKGALAEYFTVSVCPLVCLLACLSATSVALSSDELQVRKLLMCRAATAAPQFAALIARAAFASWSQPRGSGATPARHFSRRQALATPTSRKPRPIGPTHASGVVGRVRPRLAPCHRRKVVTVTL